MVAKIEASPSPLELVKKVNEIIDAFSYGGLGFMALHVNEEGHLIVETPEGTAFPPLSIENGHLICTI